jgi:primase-polymerase (primpol)-like protein
MSPSNLPSDMTERRAWVLWNAGKMPLQPNGQPAKANDPDTWHGFAECCAAVGQHGSKGVGFELSPPFVGIDLGLNQARID